MADCDRLLAGLTLLALPTGASAPPGELATAFKHPEQKSEAAWDETARKPR
jgi:hypothetical protein